MNTFLPPDRVRALLGTPGPSKAKVMPPPAKTTGGIPRAALLAGIPAGSASYAGKLVKGLR